MELPEHRLWIYNRLNLGRKGIIDEFIRGVDEFMAYACSLQGYYVSSSEYSHEASLTQWSILLFIYRMKQGWEVPFNINGCILPRGITKVPRNDDGGTKSPPISIFNHPGRCARRCKERYLTDQEMHAATSYALMNCEEVIPYINIYVEQLGLREPSLSQEDVDTRLTTEFPSWFQQHVQSATSLTHS